MDLSNIEKLIKVIKMNNEIDYSTEWSHKSTSYLNEIYKELDEVKIELKSDKQIYLEDELGDVLWDYLNFLFNLEKEKKISSIEKIFERSFCKYSERINSVNQGIN